MVRILAGALGIGAALMVGKIAAFWISGSTAILADMSESIVHNAVVGFSLYCLIVSRRPPDKRHPYGHGQVENFSALVEGSLILATGALVGVRGIQGLVEPIKLAMSYLAMWLVIAAGAVNVALGIILWKLGRRHRTIILEASGRHMLADSFTSIGAVLGYGLAILTGAVWLDAVAALVIALAIIVSGAGLLRRAVAGLMHEVDPAIDMEIQRVLAAERDEHGWDYHAVRHRRLGRQVYVELNLHFRPGVTLEQAHREASHVEHELNEALPYTTTIVTHLEPAGHGPEGFDTRR
ncbi:MAG: cation transporter [Verrucomicrobia bacterium]|nr:cation transporter [Verrucomicrobiota bacterium]